MADNYVTNPGSGGSTFASDDIAGVQYPRVKLTIGADGTATDVSAGAGAVGAGVPRMTLASDDPAVALLGTIDADTGAMVTDLAAIEVLQTAANALLGTIDADTGAMVTDLAAIETLLTTQNSYLDGLETLIGATNAQLPAALGAGDGMKVEGNVAHDAADTGGPVKVGGRAVNAEPAAVANGDRANLLTDLVGKLLVLPYSNPENFVSGAITSAMTGTTSTSLVAAPGSGLRNYITTIVVSNAHASVGTDIVIQDGSGGTALMTIPAAAVYGGAVINLPVPLRQPTTNTAIFCANVTTGASTKVSAVGYKGA